MPWLMKAEPDSRIVKGKDVKFSVDDFEEMGESPWDGVRSHEAKNIMKEKMKLGDKVLFYHSNCKVPGVYALAEISKEGYPDSYVIPDKLTPDTSWDPSHPYFDPKSNKDSPTWYMVSVRFLERLPHPVTLAAVKSLVGLAAPPDGVGYIGVEGLKAVQGMALINRGRLSVQPVKDGAYEAIVEMGRKGGFEVKAAKAKGKRTEDEAKDEAEDDKAPVSKGKKEPVSKNNVKYQKPPSAAARAEKPPSKKAKADPKLKAESKPRPESTGTRRSSRLKK